MGETYDWETDVEELEHVVLQLLKAKGSETGLLQALAFVLTNQYCVEQASVQEPFPNGSFKSSVKVQLPTSSFSSQTEQPNT